jgi:hypothetical protein
MKFSLSNFLLTFWTAAAWHACDDPNHEGSICPDGNTCCPRGDGSYSCVSGNNATSGVCCDDTAAMGVTGCGEGFECGHTKHSAFCQKIDPQNDLIPDRVPRYRLCSLENAVLQKVHGFPIAPDMPDLAYLSTMGALDASDETTLNQHIHVTTLIIMIHGSGRNVDDYICTTHAATPTPNKTLVIAPWFLAPEDGKINLTDSTADALVWTDDGPIWHTWRYGADAVNAPISAYEVVDVLLNYVTENVVRFPKLRRIVVAGHSAGGQWTQRWSLLSSSPAFINPLVHVRVVVANPKSFCYLDARRYTNESLRVPDEDEIGNCTTYNEWEWGLADGNLLPTPYKDRAMEDAGGTDALVHRYSTRDVIYLAGEMDVLPNGDCQALLQGPYRRKRSELFFASLKEVYGYQVHHRLVVAGVHHNHALMFQSPEGQEAMFGLHPTDTM